MVLHALATDKSQSLLVSRNWLVGVYFSSGFCGLTQFLAETSFKPDKKSWHSLSSRHSYIPHTVKRKLCQSKPLPYRYYPALYVSSNTHILLSHHTTKYVSDKWVVIAQYFIDTNICTTASWDTIPKICFIIYLITWYVVIGHMICSYLVTWYVVIWPCDM